MSRFESGTVALVALTLSLAGTVLLLSLILGPYYQSMFADFGGPLPAVTRFAVNATAQSVFTGILLLLSAVALMVPARKPRRIALGMVALAMGARIPLFFVAMYYPIFRLASEIK